MTRTSGLTLLTLSMIALIALPTRADDDAKPTVDPSGTWRWEHDEQGQTIKDILRIKFDAESGKGSGTYEGRIGPIKLEEVEVAGDELSCEFEVDFDGGSIEVEFEGKIEGDTVTGAVEISAGEGLQEYPWVAKRSVEVSDVLGTWDIRIELNDGNTLTPSLAISQDDDDELVAEYTSTNAEVELSVDELAVDDNKLTFTISAEFNGNTLTANYDVAPRGDKFSGTVAYDFNGQTGQLDVDAARQSDDEDDEDDDEEDDDDDDDDDVEDDDDEDDDDEDGDDDA